MNPFHSLTDDQLAEWHRLTMRCERLESDLKESRKAVEAVQNHAEQERQKFRSMISMRDNDIAELLQQNALRLSAVRDHAAALVVVLAALRRLTQVVRLIGKENVPDRFLNGWLTALTRAEDTLSTHDIPFGHDTPDGPTGPTAT